MANIEEKVEKLVEPIIEKIGYELYDVEYAKEGKNYFLRIFIDNEKGIDLNDCEKVNDAITDILDEKNYIKEQYFLYFHLLLHLQISSLLQIVHHKYLLNKYK